MDELLPEPVAAVAGKTVGRSILAFAAVQGAVIAGSAAIRMHEEHTYSRSIVEQLNPSSP